MYHIKCGYQKAGADGKVIGDAGTTAQLLTTKRTENVMVLYISTINI